MHSNTNENCQQSPQPPAEGDNSTQDIGIQASHNNGHSGHNGHKKPGSSGDISRASSSSQISHIDDIYEVDPDAVDFEPLLVSGTGKILSYHSASYCLEEEDEGDAGEAHLPDNGTISNMQSMSLSLRSPVSNLLNGNNNAMDWQELKRRRSFHMICVCVLLFSTIYMMGRRLSLFENDLTMANVQPKLKLSVNNGDPRYNIASVANIHPVLEQHMMNVNIAASNSDSSNVASVVVWAPFRHQISSTTHLVSIMSHCHGRAVFEFSLDTDSGLYKLKSPFEQTSPTSNSESAPKAIFTTSYEQAAITLFDHFHQGIFLVIVPDPMDVYAEEYASLHSLPLPETKQGLNDGNNGNIVQDDNSINSIVDNPFVRYLARLKDYPPNVNEYDFNSAKDMLKAKFIVGSCDYPSETLRRIRQLSDFNELRGATNNKDDTNESCTSGLTVWEEECKRIEERRQQLDDSRDPRVLEHIRTKHKYDILLFAYSKRLFEEQRVLFD